MGTLNVEALQVSADFSEVGLCGESDWNGGEEKDLTPRTSTIQGIVIFLHLFSVSPSFLGYLKYKRYLFKSS